VVFPSFWRTYTGDPSHTVIVGVLSVPTNEATWSPRLRMHFDATSRCFFISPSGIGIRLRAEGNEDKSVTMTVPSGVSSHTVIVGVLSVPTNEATWSPRLRMHFDAMKQCQRRMYARACPLLNDINFIALQCYTSLEHIGRGVFFVHHINLYR
jgi:hypothetical protein